jgi:hypothetical protein
VSADPAMVAAIMMAAVPLVPVRPFRCPHCGRCAEQYDGQDVCEDCVLTSFAEHG